jgi:Pyruvate/2-oxoacid:ferredoxin oxidoreductase delta subunit
MSQTEHSMAFAGPHKLSGVKPRAAIIFSAIGSVALILAWAGYGTDRPVLFLSISLGALAVSAFLFMRVQYLGKPAGIKNNGVFHLGLSARGALGWALGIAITGFYVALYWFPSAIEGIVRMFDPLSMQLRGVPADQWFTYGSFYTFAVLVMGAKFIAKYWHNRYQIIRTTSVMFVQLGFAFLLPAFLKLMSQPEFYFSYFWPLDYDMLFPDTVAWYQSNATLGMWAIIFGAFMTFAATPILTYFYGKRWYCSWVCGCGGLAETAGDPFRQLSDKSLSAWKIERWMIHTVLVLITLLTVLLWVNSWLEGAWLGEFSQGYAKSYGFFIGSVFSGVIGVGFYPIMGSRVWCRFGCPMAAYLGIIQRFFSRFRITTNGGQCISCGNCSTYCEMGIDVRSYAQKGQNIVRASCVGCGICAAVCPRGVLRLENGKLEGRINDDPILIGSEGAKLNV